MAYAAVISLKRSIERLVYFSNRQILKLAYMELIQLGDVITRLDDRSFYNRYRKYQNINTNVIDALDAEIREAVWELEDAVQSYMLHLSLPPTQTLAVNGCLQIDEKEVEQAIDSFLKRVNKFREDFTTELANNKKKQKKKSQQMILMETSQRRSEDEDEESPVLPANDFDGNKSTTVGFSDLLEKITNQLLHSGSKAISLFGMAGIGKTHLAREIYQHPTIVKSFDCRVWVTTGQKYRAQSLVVDVLSQIERKPRDLYEVEDEDSLCDRLYDTLSCGRCLIVCDDVWSKAILEHFLDDLMSNNVRFILTTRLEKVARFENVRCHHIPFMNDEESWDLLRQNVYVCADDNKSAFPPQLEKLGRKIATDCEGLPLLILAVAEILAGNERTEKYWMKVAERKTNTFFEAYEKISNVLVLSYDYLRQHLKPFFLYMGVFPQSCEILASKLINLCIAEDLLETNKHNTLERFAMHCIEKLVSSSLVIVSKKSHYLYDKIKSCKLHSAYWYLCVKEARRIKFFHALNKLSHCSEDYVKGQRRLSFQNNVLFGMKEVYESMAAAGISSTTRSLLCTGEDHEYPVPICLKNLMLLKVFDALSVRFYEFPEEVVKLLLLRYLSITHGGNLPCSISNLQHLQFLTLRQHHYIILLGDPTFLPMEIWDLRGLNYLRIVGSNLPRPTHYACLENLFTLHMNAQSCTEDVFEGIPYVRKLGIKTELHPDVAEPLGCFQHIGLLGSLDELKCVIVNPRLNSHQAVAPPHHLSNLPISLRKLSLNGLGYSWKYMGSIGSLPQLRVLKIQFYGFQGPEWDAKVGEFPSLEYLLLEDVDLVCWTVDDDDCFPQLRRLVIRHCFKLKEIPLPIGALPHLGLIEVVDCSSSAVASAKKIMTKDDDDDDDDDDEDEDEDEDEDDDEEDLKVVINSSWNL